MSLTCIREVATALFWTWYVALVVTVALAAFGFGTVFYRYNRRFR